MGFKRSRQYISTQTKRKRKRLRLNINGRNIRTFGYVYELPPEENINESGIENPLPNDEVAVNEELVYQSTVEANEPNNQATQEVNDSGVTFRLCQIFETTFIEELRMKSNNEIKEIWEFVVLAEEHSLSFTIESGTHDVIDTKTNIYGEFVVPIPRSHVYQFFRIHVCGNSVRFFPVDPMQTNIAECLAVYFYTEYKQDKGIVLVRGKFDGNILDEITSKGLVYQFLLYYGNFGHDRTAIMHDYMYGTGVFDHLKLIEQLLTLSSLSPQEEMARIRNMTPQVRLPIMHVREQPKAGEQEEESDRKESSATESENEGATEGFVNADERVGGNIDSIHAGQAAESTVEVKDGGRNVNEVNDDFDTTYKYNRETQIDSEHKVCITPDDDTELCDEVGENHDNDEIGKEANIKIDENIKNGTNANEKVEDSVEYENKMALDVEVSNENGKNIKLGDEVAMDTDVNNTIIDDNDEWDDEMTENDKAKYEVEFTGESGDEMDADFEASGEQVRTVGKLNDEIVSDTGRKIKFDDNVDELVEENDEVEYHVTSGNDVDDVKVNEAVERFDGFDNKVVVDFEVSGEVDNNDAKDHETNYIVEYKSGSDNERELEGICDVQDSAVSGEGMASHLNEDSNDEVEDNLAFNKLIDVEVDNKLDNKFQRLVNGNDKANSEVKCNVETITDSLYNRLKDDKKDGKDGNESQ